MLGVVDSRGLGLLAIAATVVLTTIFVVACDGENASDLGSYVLDKPATINLYPMERDSHDSNSRFYVFVTAVGLRRVSLPLAVDTGSSGVTLDATQIFPESEGVLDSSGFHIPFDQETLEYRGITVTRVKASRSYGGPIGRTEWQSGFRADLVRRW
jgi:hypothetical protein